MEKKFTLTLDNEFSQYCELNNIKDVNKLGTETFNRGFSLLKYGETPYGQRTKEIVEVPKEIIKEIIVEKIVERIVEVPVEVIKEVIKEVRIEVPIEVIKEVIVEKKGKTKTVTKEVIKEVPVEVKGEPQVIIKEVIVEKLIDDYECKNMLITLTEANRKLKEELDKITNSLDKLGKGGMMKKSDLSNLYDE
jgi:hypothetical protein